MDAIRQWNESDSSASYLTQIKRILTSNCRVISTKSRCPCVFDFEIESDNEESPALPILPEEDPDPVVASQSSMWSWITDFLKLPRNPEEVTSFDQSPFPHSEEDSVIYVCGKQEETIRTPLSMKPVAKHLRVLIKTNDFMRQEEMASVLIAEVIICVGYDIQIASIIKENHIPSNLHTYNVTPITNNNGILEYLDDFVSLHELRKSIKPRGYDSIGVEL